MKNLIVLSLVAISILASSCGDSEISEVKLETEQDSLSYAIGMFVSSGVKEDTNLVKVLKSDIFKSAINDVLKDDGSEALSLDDAKKVYGNYKRAEEEKVLAEAKKGSAPQAEYLEANKLKEGVVELPSGLQYKILTEGTGEKPSPMDQVKVHYHGKLIDGTVFDSSVDRGEPAMFGVTQVIPGWVEALQLMPVGSKWELTIPYNIAYGERGSGPIPPFATLVFEVELLEIMAAEAPAKN